MNKKTEKFKKDLEEATEIATEIVANPNTIETMNSKGEEVKERFISYEEYIEDLFNRKRKVALQLVTPMPKMRDDLGSAVLHSIYEEMRDSLALGMFPSAIMHSILLLEYTMRIRVYKEGQKKDPNAKWEPIAGLKIRNLTAPLYKATVITNDQKKDFEEFNDSIRNPYMHINIYEFTRGITLDVTSVDIIKGEVKRLKEFPVTENPQLWFWGKKKYDATNVLRILKKCVDYVNLIFD